MAANPAADGMIAHAAPTAGSGATDVVILRDSRRLARFAADWLLRCVLARDGAVAVCLAGGSTPRPLYTLLAQSPYRERMPWRRVHWFWGDERFVPADSPRSNYRMAWLALFRHVRIPPDNIHPIPTEGAIDEAAAAYECALQDFYGAQHLSEDRPLFAATLLGLGTDGHTASLFPGNAALGEKTRWALAVPDAPSEPRISLSFGALASSEEIAFLVSGAEKRAILTKLFAGADLPAARVRAAGRVNWFVDRAAAAEGIQQ
jgi:6-phosphogluconolactonase